MDSVLKSALRPRLAKGRGPAVGQRCGRPCERCKRYYVKTRQRRVRTPPDRVVPGSRRERSRGFSLRVTPTPQRSFSAFRGLPLTRSPGAGISEDVGKTSRPSLPVTRPSTGRTRPRKDHDDPSPPPGKVHGRELGITHVQFSECGETGYRGAIRPSAVLEFTGRDGGPGRSPDYGQDPLPQWRRLTSLKYGPFSKGLSFPPPSGSPTRPVPPSVGTL